MSESAAPSHDRLRRTHCLVLGGSGFIGVNVCKRLREAAASVRAFSRTPAPVGGVEHVVGDIADPEALARALQGIDVVFHLVGSSTPASSHAGIAADADQSIVGSIRLFEACRRAGVQRVVFASSGGTVYGECAEFPTSEGAATDPISAYGVGKLAVEKYLALFERQYGMLGLILRISNPYGPHQTGRHKQGLIGTVIGKLLAGQPVDIWGDGSIVRDYLYIDDVVAAMERAAGYEGAGRLWNIGSGVGLDIREVIAIVGAAVGRDPIVRFHPARSVDVSRVVLDCRRARDQLSWTCTTPMELGVAKTVAWFRDHPHPTP